MAKLERIIVFVIFSLVLIIFGSYYLPKIENNRPKVDQDLLVKEIALEKEKVIADSIKWYKINLNEDKWKEGKTLFKVNCQACHWIDINLTGPALKPLFDSLYTDSTLLIYLNNEKDVDAGKTPCMVFNFNFEEVQAIHEYVINRDKYSKIVACY